MSSTEGSPEPALLRRRLGAGTFATVYVVQEGPSAYKTVHDTGDADQLQNEFNHLFSSTAPASLIPSSPFLGHSHSTTPIQGLSS